MTNYTIGEDAFNAAIGTDGGQDVEWSKLNSGMSYKIRAFRNYNQAVMKFRNYSIFKVINSFSAKNPSTKNANGFAESNLTPWDLATKYYTDLMFKAKDAKDSEGEKKYKTEAGKYREKERYGIAFVDLDTGTPVHFDISPKQFTVIKTALVKYANNLGSIPFEIAKTGSGKDTVLSFMPIMTQLEPLTDKQQANFDKFNEVDFDPSVFGGFMYEIDDAEQTKLLVQAGFDVKLIGLSAVANDAPSGDTFVSNGPIEIEDEMLPF